MRFVKSRTLWEDVTQFSMVESTGVVALTGKAGIGIPQI